MHKEDDKLSLNMNEDFTLPNLEEGLNIDEIPSIEDLISIDSQEIEKIQASNTTEDTPSDNLSDTEKSVETNELELNNSFENNFESMDLFDEDVALTLDDSPLDDNNIDFNIEKEEISEAPQELETEQISDLESLEFDNTDDLFSEEESFSSDETSDTEEPTLEIQEEPVSDIENTPEEFHEIPEIVEEIAPEYTEPETPQETTEEVYIESEKIQAEVEENPVAENEPEISEQSSNESNIYTGETKHYTKSDDVFAKIDSLLNDDSAFVSGVSATVSEPVVEKVYEEMPKPKFKSTFNPAKYLGKSSSVEVAENTDEKIGILYTAKKVIDNLKNISEVENSEDKPSLSSILMSPNGKKAIIAAAVCAVVLGAGITGVSIFNNKSVEELDTLSQNDVSTPLETPDTTIPTPEEVTPSIIDANANVASNVPDINKAAQPKIEVKQDVIKSEVNKQTKPTNSESYLSVKKIQWQVPDYLSYSPNIKSYLQTAGKSIKLGLSSDLLLASEYAYSNIVKINLKMSNTGAVQSATVVTSSGSKQIDDIVLQSVKSTLNVVKPPVGEVKTPDFNLTITINL